MDLSRFEACYRQWIAGQESGLGELSAAAADAAAGRASDAELRAIVERCMLAYEEYAAGRRALAPEDATVFFSPPWCTSFENSVSWLGGCRPAMAIRLLYSLSGEGLEAHLDDCLAGRLPGRPEDMGLLGLSARQLELVDGLHRRTLHDEDGLSARLATLQEDVADKPLLPIVREGQQASARMAEGPANRAEWCAAGANGEAAAAAMGSYVGGLARLLEEADQLRLATARAVAMDILTPRQAVELLAAGKQLHLSVRYWSSRRNSVDGRQL